jgi:hypothetical protein
MSSTYSPILRTELIGSGDQAGTWGNTTNSNFQYIFENAIAGYQPVTVTPTSNNQVLTYVNGPSASAALNQSIYSILKLNAGTLSAAFNIFAPPASKTYIIWNNTSYAATFYNSTIIGNTTAAGTGAIIPAGGKAFIWSDGTNFYNGVDTTAGNFTVAGNLSVGGTLGVTGAATFASSIAAQSASFTLPLPVLSGGSGSTTATGTGSNVLSISPALTGSPTAPTPTTGDNSTLIATTAFIQNTVGTLGTMSQQNANAVNITGGTINSLTVTSLGTNAYGTRTVSTSAPSGGSNGDIWYKV